MRGLGRSIAAGAVAALTLLAGCQKAAAPRAPDPVGQIDHIDLFANPPVALNLDGAPGVDGAGVEVFFYQQQQPDAQLVTGELDILMYNHTGRTDPAAIEKMLSREPDHEWTFLPALLARQRFRHRLGLWGYRLMLQWGDDRPTGTRIVLVARYTAPGGRTLYSAPAHVTVRAE